MWPAIIIPSAGLMASRPWGDGQSRARFRPQNNFYYCPGQRFTHPSTCMTGRARTLFWRSPPRATGNDQFRQCPSQNDWYETVKLNYGVDYYAGRVGLFTPMPDTWQKMTDILLFWAAKGIDGFRCDMAEMVPAEFWAMPPRVKHTVSRHRVYWRGLQP